MSGPSGEPRPSPQLPDVLARPGGARLHRLDRLAQPGGLTLGRIGRGPPGRADPRLHRPLVPLRAPRADQRGVQAIAAQQSALALPVAPLALLAELLISDRTAAKISSKHDITRPELGDAVVCVTDLK